jgi:hypothetical protein
VSDLDEACDLCDQLETSLQNATEK